MIIPEWHDTLLLIITGFSLLCTFYTVALIIGVTPKSMSEYRWFLLLYTISDAAFTVVFGVIICPKSLFPGTGFVVQGLGRDIFYAVKGYLGNEGGDFIVRMSFMVMTWCFVNIISTQDYCLVYRFTVIHSNQRYHNFLVDKRVLVLTAAFGIFLCFVFSVPCFMFIPGTKELSILLKDFEKRYPGVFDDISSEDVIIWVDEWAGKTNVLFGIFIFGFIASEIIAISSVFVILRILKENASSFSAQTYKLHRQLTVLLIIQIINPFVFVIFPIVACILAVIFELQYQRRTGIYGTLFMSLYTISNTILTVGFVAPYRNFTKKYTLGILLKLPFLKKYQAVAPMAPFPSTSGTPLNPQLVKHQPLAFSPQYYFGVDIVILCLQIISLFCNGFITLLFIRSEKLRQNKSLFLVLLLCITDLLFAIASIPYVIYLIVEWSPRYFDYDSYIMVFSATPIIFQFKVNLIITIMIAIDRLQAIKRPLNYRNKNHKLYSFITLLIGGGSGIVDIILEVLTMDFEKHYFNCTALGCFQSKIFRAYWGISNMVLNVAALTLTIWMSLELHRFHKTAAKTQKHKKLTSEAETKFSETSSSNKLSFGILLISVIFLLIPSTFVGIIELLEVDVFQKVGPFYMIGLLFAGISNGFLYITLHSGIRQAAKGMICVGNVSRNQIGSNAMLNVI